MNSLVFFLYTKYIPNYNLRTLHRECNLYRYIHKSSVYIYIYIYIYIYTRDCIWEYFNVTVTYLDTFEMYLPQIWAQVPVFGISPKIVLYFPPSVGHIQCVLSLCNIYVWFSGAVAIVRLCLRLIFPCLIQLCVCVIVFAVRHIYISVGLQLQGYMFVEYIYITILIRFLCNLIVSFQT